jgi:HEAT repeat protein
MQCEKHKEQLERWWSGGMTEADRAKLKAELAACPDCRQELETGMDIWDLMGEMPVPRPSDTMQLRFEAMLETVKASVDDRTNWLPGLRRGILNLFAIRPRFAAAYSVLLLAAGLGLGFLFNHRTPAPQAAIIPDAVSPVTAGGSQELAALATQVHEMREMVLLSLLQNPSASERMRGVSYTSDIKNVNRNVALALLETLNNDPNVNVRLTTLEALTHFADNPVVREGLVHSIVQQESPLVQAALADVMLKLQEKRALSPFKKLLQQKDLNGMVRAKIEQTITRII